MSAPYGSIRTLSWSARGCRAAEEQDGYSLRLPLPGESDLEVLAGLPELARLESLEFNFMSLIGDPGDFNPGLCAIASSPYAVNLTTLGLYNKGPSRETLRLLGSLPRLVDLELGANGLTDEHLYLIASLPLARRLRRLALTWNHRLGAMGVRQVLDSCRLTELCLEVTGFGWRGCRPLLGSLGLTSLERLLLTHADDPGDWDAPPAREAVRRLRGLPELLRGGELRALAHLDLEGLGPGNALLDRLAGGPTGSQLISLLRLLERERLRLLDLSGNRLTDRTAYRLADVPALGCLHELNLAGNDLSEKGKQALEESPHRHRYLRCVA